MKKIIEAATVDTSDHESEPSLNMIAVKPVETPLEPEMKKPL